MTDVSVVDLSTPTPPDNPSSGPVALLVDVPGTPVPQGSMQGFARGRRVVLVADNATVLKPWRASVAEHCLARVRVAGWRTLVGPCAVQVTFWLPRPAVAHRRRWPHVKPDVDKLARAALDGIVEGGAIHDDALVVDLSASKRYATVRPGMRVRVVDLTGQPTLDGPGSGLAATLGDETGRVGTRCRDGLS